MWVAPIYRNLGGITSLTCAEARELTTSRQPA
jgi:hypothetical protein